MLKPIAWMIITRNNKGKFIYRSVYASIASILYKEEICDNPYRFAVRTREIMKLFLIDMPNFNLDVNKIKIWKTI